MALKETKIDLNTLIYYKEKTTNSCCKKKKEHLKCTALQTMLWMLRSYVLFKKMYYLQLFIRKTKDLTPALKVPMNLEVKVTELQKKNTNRLKDRSDKRRRLFEAICRTDFNYLHKICINTVKHKVRWCRRTATATNPFFKPAEILTSLRAFSNFGLFSSTFSLDCCFNFLNIAVTGETERTGKI